jgi:hypothetical protein
MSSIFCPTMAPLLPPPAESFAVTDSTDAVAHHG